MIDLGFTMGADPEFTLVRAKDGTQIYANDLVAVLGSDYPVVNMGVQMNGGVFGHDGHASTAELRPNPSSTPGELTRNLGLMISELEFLTASRANAVTDSGIEQVGGHVHISVPRDVPPHVLNAVNWTLFLCAPLLKMTSDTTRSSRVDYGHLDDVRYDMHDGTRTAELRFLPAEWLTTPRTTEAVLSYIACVYYEALHNPAQVAKSYEKFLKNGIENFNLKTLQALEHDIPSLFDFLAKKIRSDIVKFACYDQYKSQIRYILNPDKVKEAHSKVNYDAFAGWCPARTAVASKKPSAGGPTLQQFVNNESVTESKPSQEKKRKVPGKEHLVVAQTKSIEFIESYGARNRSGESPSLLSNSGDVNLDYIHDELTKRIANTGLAVTVPVYIYGVSSEHADLSTIVVGSSRNHNVTTSPDSQNASAVVRERLNRVAISHESTPTGVVMGIPWAMRRPNELEGAVLKIAELFYKIQKNELELS